MSDTGRGVQGTREHVLPGNCKALQVSRVGPPGTDSRCLMKPKLPIFFRGCERGISLPRECVSYYWAARGPGSWPRDPAGVGGGDPVVPLDTYKRMHFPTAPAHIPPLPLCRKDPMKGISRHRATMVAGKRKRERQAVYIKFEIFFTLLSCKRMSNNTQ